MGDVQSWKGNALALREFKIETAQGEPGARMESLGLENVRMRGEGCTLQLYAVRCTLWR